MKPDPKRILAIDDHKTTLSIVRFNLEQTGFNVTVAQNGREGWNLLQTEDFHVVITDLRMPEMDGEELCRRIGQDARLTNIPIILLSAKWLERDLAQLREELGVYDVITKPFSPKSLTATVEACLKQSITAD